VCNVATLRLVFEVSKHVAFRAGWLLQKRQNLVAVAGKDDLIECHSRTIFELQGHTAFLTAHCCNTRVEKNPILEWCREQRNVFMTAPADYLPLGMGIDA